ncbi:hypothetical protein AGOR_G00024240 [Albula goreensis]|uniref:Ig-like domain-containing protein n=1 Tax=Albula goreensis TaxID=1534307 RepID=A0A8T3E0V0_9TELE|nr:hypothetical protein AGOR_G00024240 [Albula goreensis]
MTWTPETWIFFLVWMVPFSKTADLTVICTFHKDCVLPCSFKADADEVIHWNRNDKPVHSFYHGADRLGQQQPHFGGRTALFKDQIRKGNASLLLRDSNIQDGGRYQCYCSTKSGNHASWITVLVHAPIQSVTMTIADEEVICSSRNIYPKPLLSWTTNPPTDELNNTINATKDTNDLYSVQSKVRIIGNISDYAYFCSVTSEDGKDKWTTSLRQQEIRCVNEGSMIIPCIAPRTFNPQFTLRWTFIRAGTPENILTYDSQTKQAEISNSWKNQLSVDTDRILSGNGSLQLQNLETSAQNGIYSCEFSASQVHHLIQSKVFCLSFLPLTLEHILLTVLDTISSLQFPLYSFQLQLSVLLYISKKIIKTIMYRK